MKVGEADDAYLVVSLEKEIVALLPLLLFFTLLMPFPNFFVLLANFQLHAISDYKKRLYKKRLVDVTKLRNAN